MITINKQYNNIIVTGHAEPVVCAGVSTIVYTTVNALLKYDKECIWYNDNSIEDTVTMKILIDDEFVSLLIENMFDMFNDIKEEYEEQIDIITE